MSDHPAKKFAESFDPSREHFDKRMIDVKTQFGHQRYSDTKCNLIFDSVFKYMALENIDIIFNEIIGNAKFAPTLNDFETARENARLKTWEEDKKEERKAAKNFFSDSQKSQFFGALAKALEGGNKSGVGSAISTLEAAYKKSPAQVSGCRHCGNSGAVSVRRKNPDSQFPDFEYEWAQPCSCVYGNQYRNSWK